MPFVKPLSRSFIANKTTFLILSVLYTIIYVWPELNFQDMLAQGDHGRDLYAFEAVLKGQLPYKDFWWVYGPIMPYYYGLFYKISGFHITSILAGTGLIAGCLRIILLFVMRGYHVAWPGIFRCCLVY